MKERMEKKNEQNNGAKWMKKRKEKRENKR